MKVLDMRNLILSLHEFKEELCESDDKMYVNVVMRMIQNTIDDVVHYRNEEELL